MAENFAGLESLVAWFQSEKRVFPWRKSDGNEVSPYAVWVSEVMLQQTRAEVVIPYFQRWMKRFPDIASLAQASEEEVIKVWEGLGYYARARRLLQAARYLVTHHEGRLPSCPSLLTQIPGFGPYTTGAVASFAFHCKAAAVDGNVLRFLSRYLLVWEDIAKPSVQKEFRKRTLELLPDHEPWVAMEAMIELGARVCKTIPQCSLCPVQETCRAFTEGRAAELPIKSAGQTTIRLVRKAVVIKCGEEVLLGQVPPGKVMAGLFEFPVFEEKQIDVRQELISSFRVTPHPLATFDDIRYSFTRYQVTLQATLWEIEAPVPWPGFTWFALPTLRQLPFSSGHRRLCEKLLHFLERD
jgi:A/G-specific adenine glycosylase